MAASDQDFLEASGRVAPRAVVTKAAAMDVVAAVAIDTLATQFGGIARPGVTGRADEPLVLAGQPETGLAVMIEAPLFPVIGVVAVLAL